VRPGSYSAVLVNISLRPATLKDRDWLYDLHRSAFREYVEQIWGWDESWQRRRFDEHFAPELTQVALIDGEAVAMLQWEDRGDEIFLRQIAVLPALQGQGIGRALLDGLLARAAASGKGVALQVFRINLRARALYERLGFVVSGESETHVTMRWSPH
jgi:ribosomal protein S18 acetylase RimI-like enzyme